MQKIKIEDVEDSESYSKERLKIQRSIVATKAPRRILLGPYLNFLFENRETMLYQVREMIHAENIRSREGMQHEIDTYNKMIPGPYELKATLLIEFDSPEIRKVKLSELVGLEKEIYLCVDQKHKVVVTHDSSQVAENKLSSVQFLTFFMGEEITRNFLETDSVAIASSHPACSYRAELSEEQLQALQTDLQA